MLLCPNGLVSNVTVSNPTVSNRFDAQCYRVQSVWCPILLCLKGLVSNPNVSNRFHFPGFCIMCSILLCPMTSITRSNYSCVQLVLCRMLLCLIGPVNPMLLSCVQSKCVQLVRCPIGLCPIEMCATGSLPMRANKTVQTILLIYKVAYSLRNKIFPLNRNFYESS